MAELATLHCMEECELCVIFTVQCIVLTLSYPDTELHTTRLYAWSISGILSSSPSHKCEER